jgi:hypothetical protein
MPNFAVTVPASPRFEGDFRIEPAPDHSPTSADKAYVDEVNAAVDKLHADEIDDAAAGYPAELLKARRVARKTAAAALLGDARTFVRGANAAGDMTRLKEIQTSYTSKVARFCATTPAQERFEGDFEIVSVPEYVPIGQDVVAFLEAIKAAGDELAADKRADKSPGFSPTAIKAREAQRANVGKFLCDQVNEFWTGPLSPKAAAEQVLLMRGQYQAKRDRLGRRLFNVHLKPRDELKDVDIRLFSGLPAPDNQPSQEKVELYVLINKTIKVIRSVCDSISERARSKHVSSKEADALYAEFMDKLEGIAVIGLELEFTLLAKPALMELRDEFFVRAAGRIKTIHVNRLAVGAGLTSAALLVVYAIVKFLVWNEQLSATSWAAEHGSFLLAACGAAIGTWASFAARQDKFAFDDLVMVEESQLKPMMRILFVMTLTMAACILFWHGAVNLEIGGLKTEANTFKNSGTVAFLIGLFAGLSERSLTTAITGRAAAFMKGISGAS